MDLSAAAVEDLCRNQIDDAVQEAAGQRFEFDSATPGAGSGTNCLWDEPGGQELVVEFFLFPFTETDDEGDEVVVDRLSFERGHQDGYTSRPQLADMLGGTGVYLRHLENYHTILVFAEDEAVFFTTIGPIALSDSQLEALACALPKGHEGLVVHSVFADDGLLITSSADGTIRFWDPDALRSAPDDRLGEALCTTFGPRMDEDSWRLAIGDEPYETPCPAPAGER